MDPEGSLKRTSRVYNPYFVANKHYNGPYSIQCAKIFQISNAHIEIDILFMYMYTHHVPQAQLLWFDVLLTPVLYTCTVSSTFSFSNPPIR